MLSPFRNQLSPLTFAIGNPRLQPEQINNLEFSYTLAQRYHVKLAYGLTIASDYPRNAQRRRQSASSLFLFRQ